MTSTDPAHPLIRRIGQRFKQVLEEEGGVNIQTDEHVQTDQGSDSVYVGGDVSGVPISVYVSVVPQ